MDCGKLVDTCGLGCKQGYLLINCICRGISGVADFGMLVIAKSKLLTAHNRVPPPAPDVCTTRNWCNFAGTAFARERIDSIVVQHVSCTFWGLLPRLRPLVATCEIVTGAVDVFVVECK